MTARTMSRIDAEILARLEVIDKYDDLFGVERSGLIFALSWEGVQSYLSAEGLAEGREAWESKTRSTDPAAEIRDYLPFAFDKAENERGLSASRSVSHLQAWVWLMGDEAYDSIGWDDYAPYGLPILRQVAALVGYVRDEAAAGSAS